MPELAPKLYTLNAEMRFDLSQITAFLWIFDINQKDSHFLSISFVSLRQKSAENLLKNQKNNYYNQPTSTEDAMISTAQKEKFLVTIPTAPDTERKFVNTDYFANVCHEIRTPLGAIVGLSAILARSDITHQRHTECATMLQNSSHMLMELINDLLDSFKIDQEKMELEYVAFDLAKVLEEARSIATVKAQEKGLSIHMQLSEITGAPYMGDPFRIRQILLNLLGNAVKFTSEGVISIYMNEVKGSKGNSEINITVADCGIGMSQEVLEKIFDKYTQGDTTISRNYGGTGLGLFISQELAHLMKGNITVKSWPNMGSQFILTLPLQKCPILSVVT